MGEAERPPQLTVRLSKDKRRRAVELAKFKEERDRYGFGLSVVVRRAIDNYLTKYEHELTDRHAADPSP